MTQTHNPLRGAAWMLTAGHAFAIVNSLAQYLSIKMHVPSTSVALIQYFIALIAMLPWLRTLGIRQSLKTNHFWLHCLRVFFAVSVFSYGYGHWLTLFQFGKVLHC